MKTNLKTVLGAFAGVCLMTAAFSACAQVKSSRAPGWDTGRQQITQNQGFERNPVNTTTQFTRNNMTGMNLGGNQGTNPDINLISRQQTDPNMEKADNLKRQLKKMNGVKNVNVIVIGNTALVGIEPTGNTKAANALRNSITKKVKEIDSTITNVTVSESSDIMRRINKLGTDITNNKPIKAITDEFNNMVNGMTS